MNWENLDQNKKIALGITVAVLVLVVVWALSGGKGESKQVEMATVSDSPVPESDSNKHSIFVEVVGQVVHPGVYELKTEPLVIELIELAGGFSQEADLLFVHRELQLAVRVTDGQKIYIPSIQDSLKSTSPVNYADKLGTKVSINTASLEQLMELEGVGEVTAEKIIANRPYESLEQLKDVEGIGDATYNKIISFLTL